MPAVFYTTVRPTLVDGKWPYVLCSSVCHEAGPIFHPLNLGLAKGLAVASGTQ